MAPFGRQEDWVCRLFLRGSTERTGQIGKGLCASELQHLFDEGSFSAALCLPDIFGAGVHPAANAQESSARGRVKKLVIFFQYGMPHRRTAKVEYGCAHKLHRGRGKIGATGIVAVLSLCK
jgi:hypothetical protein